MVWPGRGESGACHIGHGTVVMTLDEHVFILLYLTTIPDRHFNDCCSFDPSLVEFVAK